MNRLLFVDDDDDLLVLNQTYFTTNGFEVDIASNAKDALDLLSSSSYNCIILDITMEDQDGFELCSLLRAVTDSPVIFLTVHADDIFLEQGFHSGGDDYVTKPYRLKELELRINARIHPHIPAALASGQNGISKLHIHLQEKQAFIDNQSLDLTVNEFQILLFLSQNKGTAFRQDKIYEALWGEQYNTHSIQVLIMRIRRKIKALSPEKEYIRTQWGKGYIFTD